MSAICFNNVLKTKPKEQLENAATKAKDELAKSQNELGFKDLYFGAGEFDESKLGKKISLPASS